jgi:hypothetical protein
MKQSKASIFYSAAVMKSLCVAKAYFEGLEGDET